MKSGAVCEEKAKLVSEYQKATLAYSNAVAELQRIIGISSRTDYDAQYRMTEALRLDAASAQAQLEQHIARHRC